MRSLLFKCSIFFASTCIVSMNHLVASEDYFSRYFDYETDGYDDEEEEESKEELQGYWKEMYEKVAFVEDDLDSLLLEDEESEMINCKGFASTESQRLCREIEELQAQVQSLREELNFIDQEQLVIKDSIEAVGSAPDPSLLADVNFLMVGTSYALFRVPNNYNHTFDFVTDPVFLWRYKDNLLYELKLDFRLNDCGTDVNLVFSTIDYVYNDCLTIRAGKFSTPLGLVWEKMTTGWINKLPTLPAPYTPRRRALLPPAEVGVDLRGAIPVKWCCRKDFIGIPMVMGYDFWVGNGPNQYDDDIRLYCNGFDNNNNIAVGGRVSFRPVPYREIGFSTTLSRWNNNSYFRPILSKDALWYSAIVLDWNWGINKSSQFMGELMWTRHDTIKNRKRGIPKCHATQWGGWFQYSRYFDKICCGKYKNWEGIIRFGFVESDIRHLTRRQVDLGLNYYFSDVLIFKMAYEINHGSLYPNHEFLVQLAHAY